MSRKNDYDGDVREESSTQDMIALLDDMQKKDVTWVEAVDDLPENAGIEDGDLWAYNSTAIPGEKQFLTLKRKKILRSKKKNPDYTGQEVADDVPGSVSRSHVNRTIRTFDFLLHNDKLYEAFVRTNFSSSLSDQFTVECEHEDCDGLFKRVNGEKQARTVAENHCHVWGHTPTVKNSTDTSLQMYDASSVDIQDSETQKGVDIIREEFGSLTEFFQQIFHNELDILESSSKDEDGDYGFIRPSAEKQNEENSNFTEDELFALFRVSVQSEKISEDLERKIAELM